MKRIIRLILIIVIALISLNGIVQGFTMLFRSCVVGTGHLQFGIAFHTPTLITYLPKIVTGIIGLVGTYFYFRSIRFMNVVLVIWFFLQFLQISIRTFSLDRSEMHERILFDASTSRMVYGWGWWIDGPKNTEMLCISINFMFVFLCILFLIMSKKDEPHSRLETPSPSPDIIP